jgi:O-antigen/teichoic acid export membrane protein
MGTAITTEAGGDRSMSLKVFHVFFISLATLMCLGVAGWNASAWMAGGSAAHLAQAVGWTLAAIGLSIYGLRFLRKYRNLGYLAVLFVATTAFAGDALACSVCFGNPESQMTKSMVAGIWVMLGCIGVLLAGFAGLFLYWTYRSYHPHLYREEGATH